MIQALSLPLALVFLSKDLFFISVYFSLDKNIFSLIFIFPIISLLISFCSFTFNNNFDTKFYNFLFFFIFFFLFFCFSSNFSFFFLLFLELCVFWMILLILNFSKDVDKFSSVFFMFIINSVGSIPFMYFSSLFSVFLLGFEVSSLSVSSSWIFFCCFLLLISKIPLFFFHFWLTKAHVSASGSGSMILASLMLKIGTLGVYKFCFFFLSFSYKFFFSLFCAVSVFSCIFLAVVMTRFFDVKYMVACSSILHMSILFPSSLLPNSYSILGSLMMMVGHGLISCFIFFLVTVIYELSLNRSSDSSKSLESSSSVMSLLFYCFFLFNLGFPPFLSFLSEFALVSMFLKFSKTFLILFCCSLMIVGLLFMFIVLGFLFGKSLKQFNGALDPLILSCFLFFCFYFFPLMLIFN